MTSTNGSGLVKSKELLIQTNIAVEDLLDVAATMLSVWKQSGVEPIDKQETSNTVLQV
jgi:hypothetical protein